MADRIRLFSSSITSIRNSAPPSLGPDPKIVRLIRLIPTNCRPNVPGAVLARGRRHGHTQRQWRVRGQVYLYFYLFILRLVYITLSNIVNDEMFFWNTVLWGFVDQWIEVRSMSSSARRNVSAKNNGLFLQRSILADIRLGKFGLRGLVCTRTATLRQFLLCCCYC